MPVEKKSFRRQIGKAKAALLTDTSGSQLLEFAVALPLLVVFVVGIFDFGGAFNLKQMLNNIAREGARFASSLPTNDLDAIGTPPSVTAVRDLVVSHLQMARLNDCGLAGQLSIAGRETGVRHCSFQETVFYDVNLGAGGCQSLTQLAKVIDFHVLIVGHQHE